MCLYDIVLVERFVWTLLKLLLLLYYITNAKYRLNKKNIKQNLNLSRPVTLITAGMDFCTIRIHHTAAQNSYDNLPS